METLGFFLPPPFAIAHHLVRMWALHDGPFFKAPAAKASDASANGAASTQLQNKL